MLFYINLVKLEIVRLLGKQELHSFRDGWSRFERERESTVWSKWHGHFDITNLC